jgi:hypothetical protein
VNGVPVTRSSDPVWNNERILFTTFTMNLAADIKETLRKVCNSEELKLIEVVSLDSWISHYLKKQNYNYK